MKKNRFIAMVLGAALLTAQFSSAVAVRGGEGDGTLTDLEESFKVWVSDATDRDFSYDEAVDGVLTEKSFNDESDAPPLLQGNPYVDVDISENSLIDSVTYKFTNGEGNLVGTEYQGTIDVNSKSQLYPDVEKSKQGYMTAQHYDVSTIPKYSSTGSSLTDAQLKERWTNKSQVFGTPMSEGIIYKSAKTATSFTSGSAFPYYTLRTINPDGTRSYSTNTVFYTSTSTEEKNNGTVIGSLTEASKFWGYIKFPNVTENTTFYFGSIADDGSRVAIIDDRTDSPNKTLLNKDNELIVNDNFVPQSSTFKTENKGIIIRPADNGKYFPIYMEYFNYGGSGMFMLIYDTSPFEKTSQTASSLSDLQDKDKLGSTVKAVGEEWFYPSKSTDPASEPTAKFQSTARDGIEFPTADGTYYVTITETMTDGTVRELTLGPFIIDNTRPDGIMEKNPANYTASAVNISMKLTQYSPDSSLRVNIEQLIHIDSNGNENIIAENLAENKTVAEIAEIKYHVNYNGIYKFVYRVSNISDRLFFIEGSVTAIDRNPPETTLSLSAITKANGTVDQTKATLKISSEDKESRTAGYLDGQWPSGWNTAWKTVPEGFNQYAASGSLSLVEITYKNTSGSSGTGTASLTGINVNSGAKSASWEIEATVGKTYTVTMRDMAGNISTKSIDVVVVEEEPPITDFLGGTLMNLDFATVDKGSLYKGEDEVERLNLVEEGRFQAVLTIDLNNNGLLTKLKEAMGSMITVNFSSKVDEVETAPNFEIIRIQSADKYQWITVNSDKKSMRISIDNYDALTNPLSLVLFFDIGAGHGAEPTISISEVEVMFDGATYNAENGGQGKLNLRIIDKPKIN